MKKLRNYMLILGFGAILFLPVLLHNVNNRFGLTGVTSQTNFPALTKEGILNGSVQENMNAYFSENLPGRDLMIKVRNQLIFSLFAKSPNENIVIGKNLNLFEKEYVLKYEKVYPPATEEYVRDLCDKLTVIQEKLNQRGKELYIFITPTKVRYYEEDVPDIYRVAVNFGEETGNYEILTSTLKDYDFKVYDSIPFLNEYAKTAAAANMPLYYKTGSHWTWVVGAEAASDFTRFLSENSKFDFPETKVDYHPLESPIHPDADIFLTFNMFTKPYDSYYTANMTVLDQPASEADTSDKPNLFCRGGSFMGQTLTFLINNQMFDKDTYVENTLVCRERFLESNSFSDYSELNLKEEIDQADIVILEVNEAHIPTMSFGLIDYLAENPQLLDE